MTTLTIIFLIQCLILGLTVLGGLSLDRTTDNANHLAVIEFFNKFITLQFILAIGSIVYILLSKLLV